MQKARPQQGFTLVEIMVVIAIIGVLSAVAVPAFIGYTKKSKTTEARGNVSLIVKGAVSYYNDRHADEGVGGAMSSQFPATVAVTPAGPCCAGTGKCVPRASDWDGETWSALQFGMADPHLYRYEFISSGTGAAATFFARARGDLDCDGVESTFQISGQGNAGGQAASVSTDLYHVRPLE